MKILGFREALRDKLGADHLIPDFDEAPIRLVRKYELSDPRHCQRIDHAKQNGEEALDSKTRQYLFPHDEFLLRKPQDREQPVEQPDSRKWRDDTADPVDQQVPS